MTTFLGSYERPRRQPLGETSRIGRLVRLSEDTLSAVVELGNEQFELPVSPGKYVLGANVAVLESKGKPRRVSGPAGVWPEGLDADADAPDTVTAVEQLGPVEFSPEDQAILDQTVADLGQAQADLQDAFERIGNLATEVGFAWSGSFEFPGQDFRVDWTALGGGEFRLNAVNAPVGASYSWSVTLPGGSQVTSTDSVVLVTVSEAGAILFYVYVDNGAESYDADGQIDAYAPMLDATGPLQAAIADASAAAVRASRIAPRSRHEPTIEDGDNRPTGAVWTLVNAEGEELAYWAWNGTEWVPQALSTQVIPYLDAAHISTGVLDADRINVTEIWGQIATFGKIITEQLIATGAVTAEALNIAHVNPLTGYAWRAEPEGLTFLDENGDPTIVLRTDMENYFTISKDGKIVAAINPEGGITGQTVSANQSLLYRGEELDTLLAPPARGVLARSSNFGQGDMTVGTEPARVAAVSLTTPTTNRNIRISFEGRVVAERMPQRPVFSIRQADTPYVRPTNSAVKTWWDGPPDSRQIMLSHTSTVDELTWPYGEQISVGFFAEARGTSTMQFLATDLQQLVIEDLGPVVSAQQHPPYVPSGGGGTPIGTRDQHLWREQVVQMQASWAQTYTSTGAKYSYVFHGVDLGKTRASQGFSDTTSGLIGFPSVVTELSGATIKRVRVRLTNVASTRVAGPIARLFLHEYSSAPATFMPPTGEPLLEEHFERGETKVIDIPESYWPGIKSGEHRGLVLSAPSTMSNTHNGGWDAINAYWEVIYEK